MKSVVEASPDTFNGSFNNEQLLSRIWMARRLNDTGLPIKSCAVLGSWYGLLPYVLRKVNRIPHIVAVDSDENYINHSKKFIPHIPHVHKDCNNLYYKNVDCVVNPSINNIVGDKWYHNIPEGKLCLFQTEDIECEDGCPKTLEELKQKYKLSKYLYEGKLNCHDKDGQFTRSMIIGIK